MKAFAPSSLDEAVLRLTEDPDLRLLAGCTDLMVAEPEDRLGLPGVLDLRGLSELRRIEWRDEALEIGAVTPFSQIRDSPEVQKSFPALAEAASKIGGWQIQNRASLGGNMANASPAGDSLPVLLVLEAQVVLVGPEGTRTVPYREFHLGYRQTALGPGEIIGWVRLPKPPENAMQFFRKVGAREAQAISKVVVALLADVSDGRVSEYRLAAGSVAEVPLRLTEVEEAMVGRAAKAEIANLAGHLAAQAVRPIDDVRSTAEYRRFALEQVVRRMTLQLVRRVPE
jgi:CO/xanthine dehydrogenase FAD-binding subunit